MLSLLPPGYPSYSFRHTFILPEKMPFYMTESHYRNKYHGSTKTIGNFKSIISTTKVLTMFDHYPFSCVSSSPCHPLPANMDTIPGLLPNHHYTDPELAHLHH